MGISPRKFGPRVFIESDSTVIFGSVEGCLSYTTPERHRHGFPGRSCPGISETGATGAHPLVRPRHLCWSHRSTQRRPASRGATAKAARNPPRRNVLIGPGTQPGSMHATISGMFPLATIIIVFVETLLNLAAA